MRNGLQTKITIPTAVNFVRQGTGNPVILIHGLAASLHDWDELIPELAAHGHGCYALDLLGHGESPKPVERAYRMDWLFEHFFHWVESLELHEPAIVIGHSLGGYVALEYARRFPAATRGLVLVDPFYSSSQLPLLLRAVYRRANLSGLVARQIPEWLVRFFVDLSSVAMGHGVGALHSLPEKARLQTVLDYKRTAPGVYHIPNAIEDLTPHLSEIRVPALVVWGERDQTLTPASFSRLVEQLPQAQGEVLPAWHVPHQTNAEAFNQIVMNFLKEIE
jgi:pimeloyl-ACP methyl ester carboxylesterase